MHNQVLHIVLIGNYRKDNQMSMNLFAKMLYDGYTEAGHTVETWYPTQFLGSLTSNTLSGIGKWLAYIDKWIFFPLVMRLKLISKKYQSTKFHICDHSNAVYIASLPKSRTLITCHDVLAIKGAFGDQSAYCDASKTGVILQKWILNSLLKANKIATVSQTTLQHLKELSSGRDTSNKDWRVVLNAFNEPFSKLSQSEIETIFKRYDIQINAKYILHVGSDLPRKNRVLLVEMLHSLKDSWDGVLVLAGQSLNQELTQKIHDHQLTDRVISIVHPTFELLKALYSACDTFVFPSFSEGFGWPVIEAQACGAPVIASNYAAIAEVAGDAALLADPNKVDEFVLQFKSLQDQQIRTNLLQNAEKNIQRFNRQDMINKYIEFLKA